MIETIGSTKAAGISRFAGHISRYRQPLFLQRNLQQALAYHESQVKGEFTDERDLMEKLSRFEQSLSLPRTNDLGDLIQRSWPDFTVQVKALRQHAKENITNGLHARKRKRLGRFACEIEVAVWKIGHPNEPNELCVRIAQEATLQARQVDSGEYPEFHVSMQPITFSTTRLRCDISRKGGGWYRGMMKNYHLTVCVRFENDEDANACLDLIEPENATRDEGDSTAIYLATNWSRFPKLPLSGEPLPVHIAKRRTKLPTSYFMDAEMGFRVSDESVLAEHNRILRIKAKSLPNVRSSTINCAPASKSSAPADRIVANGVHKHAVAGRIKLGFVWVDQEKFVQVRGFCCAHCEHRQFPSHELLLHHMRNTHPHWKSRLREGSHNRFAALRLDYVVELSLAQDFTNKKREVPLTKRELDAEKAIQWVAPKRPFDIQKYLKGEDDWASQPKLLKTRKVESPVRRHSVSAPTPVVNTTNAPEDVEELPARSHVRTRVPTVSGGKTLFKLDSKRPLRAGELVSESDDDIESEWIKPRQDKLIGRSEMSDRGKAFSTLWNDYLDKHENLSGDGFLGDAVVRFLRKHGDCFLDKEQNEYMHALLECYHRNGILQASFLNYAQGQLQQMLLNADTSKERVNSAASVETPVRRIKRASFRPAQPNRGSESPPTSTRRSARQGTRHVNSPSLATAQVDDSMDIDTPTSRPAQEPSPIPKTIERSPDVKATRLPDGEHCVCGEKVAGSHRTIICSNFGAGCNQPRYHMKCLNLRRRPEEWLCPLCRHVS